MRALESAYTVGIVIQTLQEKLRMGEVDTDSPLLFVCNYGDRGRTQQALPIEELDVFSTKNLSKTAYSESGISFDEEKEEESEGIAESIIILR